MLWRSAAPAHNMFAEKTLGLADYHFRNAHNVKIGFVDAKVKSKINKTLPWLCSKPHDEQEKIIKFYIGQAQKLKLLIHTHELNIAKEQDKRLLERDQKKDSSYRRKLQKKIQSVAEGNAELCIEFPEMDESHINITKAILANPEVINGLYFEQLWVLIGNEEAVKKMEMMFQ